MTILEFIKAAGEFGVLAVLAYGIYLFITGKIMSEHTVEKIMKAQANHMETLRGEVTNLRKDWGKKLDKVGRKLDKVIDLLETIRDNGAMNQRRD